MFVLFFPPASAHMRAETDWWRFCPAQIGFNDFLTRCEILDFDLDGKMTGHGKMTIKDITRMKVRCMSLAGVWGSFKQFSLHAARVWTAAAALHCVT